MKGRMKSFLYRLLLNCSFVTFCLGLGMAVYALPWLGLILGAGAIGFISWVQSRRF